MKYKYDIAEIVKINSDVIITNPRTGICYDISEKLGIVMDRIKTRKTERYIVNIPSIGVFNLFDYKLNKKKEMKNEG